MHPAQKFSPAAALALFALALAPATEAALDESDLPAAATWYFHADLDEMRSSEAGAALYTWLEQELFSEVRKESGVDLGKEVDRVTAWSENGEGAVMIVDGAFSRETRDKALVAAAAADHFETLKAGRKTYYFVRGDGRRRSENVNIDGLGDEFYFSFDVRDKLVLATGREEMEAMLANDGRIAGNRSHGGALFILTAERSMIQAGMDTRGIDDEGEGFKSNILRNTRQVALMVAQVADNIAIDVQLLATEAAAAESLASIVRGLIALQAFSAEADPRVSQLLQGTRVDVEDARLKISVALSRELIDRALDGA
jgi:hypothetical protein